MIIWIIIATIILISLIVLIANWLGSRCDGCPPYPHQVLHAAKKRGRK